MGQNRSPCWGISKLCNSRTVWRRNTSRIVTKPSWIVEFDHLRRRSDRFSEAGRKSATDYFQRAVPTASLSLSYLAELKDRDDGVTINFIKETPKVLSLEMKSRHRNRKSYRLHVEYEPLKNEIEGIKSYRCGCPNGLPKNSWLLFTGCHRRLLHESRKIPSVDSPARLGAHGSLRTEWRWYK